MRARWVWGVVASVVGVGLLGSGCGIRATTVPVDVGAAPSRVSCDTPADQVRPVGDEVTADVELVCGSQLVGVKRVLPGVEKKPVREAQALLAELQKDPTAEERDAGFSTGVPDGLGVAPARAGDPKGTLRLSRKPEDLPPLALAQIVCTFADTAARPGGPVVLGGPDADPPRAWECTEAVRARPEAVPTLGEIVRATPSPT
ncbi:hypothetical protein ACIQUQ_11770 [Streptomyces sp. NPDC101118]|uniref:hypothetical protein n=1 Tax=Streptomyces sp. NPDC101118 TaxID=3366109 RepID=UPI0038051C59